MSEDIRTQQIEKRLDPQVSGGIAMSGNASGTLTIAPQNMAEMFEFAKMMAISGPCVRPAFRGNPGACLAIALQAFRTGADPYSVANKAYVTKNNKTGEEQIAYEAQYIHSILNTSGQLAKRLRPIYTGAGLTRQCKIVGYIVGEDDPFEYDSPEIGKIPVKNSPLWQGDPDQQLFYYSSRAWGRRHLPEVLLGMYTPDEIRGEIIDMTPVSVTEAPPRPRREDFVDTPAAEPEPEPEPECLYAVVDLDGIVEEFSDQDRAAFAFERQMDIAASIGEDSIEGVWESNALFISALREHGRSDIADEMHHNYAAALTQARGKTSPGVGTISPPAEAQERAETISPRPSPPPAPGASFPIRAFVYHGGGGGGGGGHYELVPDGSTRRADPTAAPPQAAAEVGTSVSAVASSAAPQPEAVSGACGPDRQSLSVVAGEQRGPVADNTGKPAATRREAGGSPATHEASGAGFGPVAPAAPEKPSVYRRR